MDVRQKMIDWRKKHDLTLEHISRASGVSKNLLELVENGSVTHPDIARQIGEAYCLSEDDILELMPKNRRSGREGYDPDKYKLPPSHNGKRMKIVSNPVSVIDLYARENSTRIERRYRRSK